MSLIEGVVEVIASFGGGHILSKAANTANEHIVVPKIDSHAREKLLSDLLDKYGNEVFYNDFDAYLKINNVIENLIAALRGETNIQPVDKMAFIDYNAEKFINSYHTYSKKITLIRKISDVLSLIYDSVYENTLGISPYTDAGRLQCDLNTKATGFRNDIQEILHILQDMQQEKLNSCSLTIPGIATTANEEIVDCTPAVETVKNKIKYVEDNYQHNSLFNKALEQYMEILQEVALTLSSQPKNQIDSLLCTLNCNIALCYSNLDNIEKALSSLRKTPDSVAQKSKTYNFVFAVIAVQKKDPSLYEAALSHINQALFIDHKYHRAFMVKQYIRALLSQDSLNDIIQDLDAYFTPQLDNLEKDKIAEYYLYRGMINLHFNCFDNAVIDYENALENGYNPIVGNLNLAIAKYHTSIAELPRDKRILLPLIKMKPMLEAEKILIDIIQKSKSNPDSFSILRHAITFYVSACTLIGKPHQLTPISEYLFEGQDYESNRAIIMGSSEELTKEQIDMLSSEDALFYNVREMLRQNNIQECKQKLATLVDAHDPSISPPVYNLLLQSCLFLNSPSDYWCYRVSAEQNGVTGDLLRSYDAWAYDLEGKTDAAKAIIDQIAYNSYDDGLLSNALQFYERNAMHTEQKALLLRMHNLQKNQQIYIIELDSFYNKFTDFFVNQKCPEFAQLFSEFPEKSLTRNAYLRMQGKYYSEVNDLEKLITCLSELWNLENTFTYGLDLAICLYRAMRYNEAIAIGEKLEKKASPEQKTKLYWLLSDANLFNDNLEASFEWAKKAHELTLHVPYDYSHQAYFGRAMACNHQEVLSSIAEYKETHPVVVDWFHTISIPKDGKDFATELKKKLEEIAPQQLEHEKQQKTNIALYRSGLVPINLLFCNYGHRLSELYQFSLTCKLNIASGNSTELKRIISDKMVVDAQTLIFSALFGGIDAIKLVPRLYMNYGSIVELQQTYLVNLIPCLKDLLLWVKNSNNIIFLEDGFIDSEKTTATILSNNFISCCNIAQQRKIPYLYYDQIANRLQSVSEFDISNNIEFITLPTLCFNKLKSMPEKLAETLYGLLKCCSFVSFTSDTIVQTIKSNHTIVTDELIEPFMCCNSDCDMTSFAKVYLGAIRTINHDNKDAALQLTLIVLSNAKKVWKRGSYYHITYDKYHDNLSKAKLTEINKYLQMIIKGIHEIYYDIPNDLKASLDELKECLG